MTRLAATLPIFALAFIGGCAGTPRAAQPAPASNPGHAEPAPAAQAGSADAEQNLPRIVVVDIDRDEAEREANTAARAALEQEITLALEAASLRAALTFIAEQAGVELSVNWPMLALVEVPQAAPITLSLNDVPARFALDAVLDAASAKNFDDDRLGYRFAHGILTVSTIQECKRHIITRAYDIAPLAAEPYRPIGMPYADNAFAGSLVVRNQLLELKSTPVSRGALAMLYEFHIDAMKAELEALLNGDIAPAAPDPDEIDPIQYARQVLEWETRPRASSGLFGDSWEVEGELTRGDRLSRLEDLIADTVGDPDEWLDEESTIRELNGDFIIATTAANHEQIERLLNGLLYLEMRSQARALRDAQVVMLLNQATQLQIAGDYAAALPVVDRALMIDPDHVTAHAMRRVVAQTRERMEE